MVAKIKLALDQAMKKGILRERVCVDSTGGTKPMTAGAIMAAALLGLRNVYVTVERDRDSDEIIQGTMRLIELTDPLEILGYLEAKIAFAHMLSYEYPIAATIFRELASKTSDFRLRKLWECYGQLSEGLELWDKFDFHQARGILQGLVTAFQRHAEQAHQPAYATLAEDLRKKLDVLEELAKPGASQTKIFELFSNANRRLTQGRYDDSCARTYRCLEAIAQHVLAIEFHLTLPEIENIGGLERCYDELATRRHPLGVKFMDHEMHDRFRGLLTFRNNSILAHGWLPIGKKPATDLLALSEGFLREYCLSHNVDFDSEVRRVQHPHVEMPETNI
jgi:CRISPR-associated protein (TIGR02710 family)